MYMCIYTHNMARNSVSGAAPPNLPLQPVYTTFFRERVRGPPLQEKLVVYTGCTGRFGGPSPDTEFQDLTTSIKKLGPDPPNLNNLGNLQGLATSAQGT